MKYPKRSPYLKFKRTSKDEYCIEHWLFEKSYKVDRETARFLWRLDGKHDPYALMPDRRSSEVRELLDELGDNLLLASRRQFLPLGLGSCLYPLSYMYPNKRIRQIGGIINFLLMLLCVPMLALGLHMFREMSYLCFYSWGQYFTGMGLGLIAGLTLHELSHACAGLAFGASVSEFGVGTHHFLPIGYVLMDQEPVAGRFRKAQINAAGIEMNLILFGVFMCLMTLGVGDSFIMYMAGFINLGMAVINALPLDGLDGLNILSDLLGKKDLLSYAKRVIRRRKKWLKGSDYRAGRYATLTASYALVCFQIALPALLIYEGYSIVKLASMLLTY